MITVTLLDFGLGNIQSVARAIEACDGVVSIATTPEDVLKADRLVVPGVGAYGDGVRALMCGGIDDAIHFYVKTGKPLLGICLGMQLLTSSSEEFGFHHGLDLIPGRVTSIPACEGYRKIRKVPHVGWNSVHYEFVSECVSSSRIVQGIPDKQSFYFLHSFAVQLENILEQIASCEYKGYSFAAIIQKDNIYGCQFHPEKSGPVGLKLLSNFLKI